MALKAVIFPAIYERLTIPRTDDEIFRDLSVRFDSPASEVRHTATSPLAPPPPDREVPATKTIGRNTSRRKPAGRTPGKESAVSGCTHPESYNIGNAKTPGKVRLRCVVCRRERTVPEAQAPVRKYRPRTKTKPKGNGVMSK